MKLKFLVVFALLISSFFVSAKRRVDNIFYVQNTIDGFKNIPRQKLDKVKLLKDIGFDGLEGAGLADFYELRSDLEQVGLHMPTNYVALSFGSKLSKGSASLSEIKEMIKGAEKGSVVYFNVQSEDYKNNKDAGDKLLSVILQDLSDYASNYGVKLCVYPHLSLYCETLEHSLKLAKLVSRNNFGCVINLCHLLKVEGSQGIEQKIKSLMPYLIAVNICGADGGNTQQLGWDRLIQPLGEGSFDTYNFVQTLWDVGYKGPVGLQCYNLKGEATQVLKGSFQTWQEYKKRYSKQK